MVWLLAASGLAARSVTHFVAGPLAVYTGCNADPNCRDIPGWEQGLLGLIGCAIAFAILYGLYRLIMHFSPHALDPPTHDPPDDTRATDS